MATETYACFDCHEGRIWIKGQHPESKEAENYHRANKTSYYWQNTKLCPKCQGTQGWSPQRGK